MKTILGIFIVMCLVFVGCGDEKSLEGRVAALEDRVVIQVERSEDGWNWSEEIYIDDIVEQIMEHLNLKAEIVYKHTKLTNKEKGMR